MLTFGPTLIRDSGTYELPRPILAFNLRDAWDFESFKVPFRDGESLTGHSRNAVDITIDGQIGSQSGQLRLDEQAMFETLEDLRAALHVSGPEQTFLLSLYQDQDGFHRYFSNCTTVRLDSDLSNKHLFNFSIQIRAADPTIHHGLLP